MTFLKLLLPLAFLQSVFSVLSNCWAHQIRPVYHRLPTFLSYFGSVYIRKVCVVDSLLFELRDGCKLIHVLQTPHSRDLILFAIVLETLFVCLHGDLLSYAGVLVPARQSKLTPEELLSEWRVLLGSISTGRNRLESSIKLNINIHKDRPQPRRTKYFGPSDFPNPPPTSKKHVGSPPPCFCWGPILKIYLYTPTGPAGANNISLLDIFRRHWNPTYWHFFFTNV